MKTTMTSFILASVMILGGVAYAKPHGNPGHGGMPPGQAKKRVTVVVVHEPAPRVVVAPAPRVVAPAPRVVVAPAPRVVAPAPRVVVTAPRVVVPPPPSITVRAPSVTITP